MKQRIFLFLLTTLVFISINASAQGGRPLGTTPLSPPPPPDRPIDFRTDSPTDIPFDGGLSLVALAGVAYAAKKGYDKRKKQKQQ